MTDERVMMLLESLGHQELEGMIITRPENRRYLTGFSGSAGVFLILKGKGHLFVDSRYIEQAQEECPLLEVILVESVDFGTSAQIVDLIRDTRVGALGFEADHLTFDQHRVLSEKLPFVTLKPMHQLVEDHRRIKNPDEIARIREAAVITDRAYGRIRPCLRPGARERDVCTEIQYQLRKEGSEGESFDTIVVSGARSSLIHGQSSHKEIHAGDTVLMDFGAVFQGYHADMTRTVVMEKASSKQREVFTLLLKAQEAALSLIQPGVTCEEVDTAAREVLKEGGYGDYFTHGIGHGVGLAIHEAPRLKKGIAIPLVSGMVVTVEPGIYIPGEWGCRIEDLVLVTDQGCEVLSHSPKEMEV
ncbi:MAG: aminopeptidase P family protein [Armatimonadetes bacterium]|nr:aminopeptidase P family protein [Armatimonadota bacterium]